MADNFSGSALRIADRSAFGEFLTMSTPADRDTDTLLAKLYPPGVAVCFLPTLPANAKLLPAERDCTGGMVEKRRIEFTHGRHCARQAMQILGVPAVAIPKGADRAPVWPEGIRGSISHSGGAAAAVIARASELAGIGLDLESSEPLGPEIAEMVCRPDEQATGDGDRAKLLFSIKEAIYKCIFPSVGCYVDFQEMEVLLNRNDANFRARSHSPNFDAHLIDGLQGRYYKGHEILFSSAWIPHV
jgi:4'-phosphopantetheinyl transferase EntD